MQCDCNLSLWCFCIVSTFRICSLAIASVNLLPLIAVCGLRRNVLDPIHSCITKAAPSDQHLRPQPPIPTPTLLFCELDLFLDSTHKEDYTNLSSCDLLISLRVRFSVYLHVVRGRISLLSKAENYFSVHVCRERLRNSGDLSEQ